MNRACELSRQEQKLEQDKQVFEKNVEGHARVVKQQTDALDNQRTTEEQDRRKRETEIDMRLEDIDAKEKDVGQRGVEVEEGKKKLPLQRGKLCKLEEVFGSRKDLCFEVLGVYYRAVESYHRTVMLYHEVVTGRHSADEEYRKQCALLKPSALAITLEGWLENLDKVYKSRR